MKKILLLVFFPFYCFCQKNYDYKNLVLEGGGIRGLAYAGVCTVLEQKGILQHIEKVGGSSAGAIAGMMICLGYTAAEIDSILFSLPIQDFNDGKGGVLGKYKRFSNRFGLYKGRKFELWLKELVAVKTGNPGLTFGELHQLHLEGKGFKDLYCTGTNLSKQQLEIFSYQHTPGLSVALAVRISGGIPLYFEPVALDSSLKRVNKADTISAANYYVDGGMLCNYPISFFDSCETNSINPLLCEKVRFNPQTIGIKLERQQQIEAFNNNSNAIPGFKINTLRAYLSAFSNLMMESIARKYPGLENEKGRTIYVNQGNISPRIKRISLEDRKMMYDNGVQAAEQFLK